MFDLSLGHHSSINFVSETATDRPSENESETAPHSMAGRAGEGGSGTVEPRQRVDSIYVLRGTLKPKLERVVAVNPVRPADRERDVF